MELHKTEILVLFLGLLEHMLRNTPLDVSCNDYNCNGLQITKGAWQGGIFPIKLNFYTGEMLEKNFCSLWDVF